MSDQKIKNQQLYNIQSRVGGMRSLVFQREVKDEQSCDKE
jgi:hypothetical protein